MGKRFDQKDRGDFDRQGPYVRTGTKPGDCFVTRSVKMRWYENIQKHGAIYAFCLMKDFEENEIYFKCIHLKEVLLAGKLWDKYCLWRKENP